MRFVITGARGMLGSDLGDALSGRDVLALGHSDLNITDLDAVKAIVRADDVIINCAAFTKVDDAETNEDAAFLVNAVGVQDLAIAAREVGAKLITISTDYVFRGDAASPYKVTDAKAPLSAYGRTKSAGEDLAFSEFPEGTLVVRSAWLYGKHGANFAQTMLNLSAKKDRWSVVTDQLGQPTWSMDLAQRIIALAEMDAPAGIYHCTNAGEASWFEFAQAVLTEAGIDASRIEPTDSSHFIRPAPRPSYSVLDDSKWETIGLAPLRDWRDALHAAFTQQVFSVDAA